MNHTHDMLDSDPRFIIDPVTREITYSTEYDEFPILVQGDHNSQHFTFELPRYIDGHDMTLCNEVFVNYINISAENTGVYNTGKYRIVDLKPDPDDEENYVLCTWVVSGGATSLVGNLSFMVRFTCVTETTLDYAWNTGTYSNVTIVSAITDDSIFEQEYTDILQVWRYELIEAGDSSLAAIEDAKNDAITTIGDIGGIMASETEPVNDRVVAWVADLPEEEQEFIEVMEKSDIFAIKSTNEFDESKLPSKIYYKVIEPEWVNNTVLVDESTPYEVSSIEYAEEEMTFTGMNDLTLTADAGDYYIQDGQQMSFDNDEVEPPFPELPPLQRYTRDNEKLMVDSEGKFIRINTEVSDITGSGSASSTSLERMYITTFRYEDGSPVEAPLTLYPAEIIECYDFENLQFTTEADGNTLLGDVYSYVDEWGNRCYTLYPDYTPNIKEGTSAISLAVSDPEDMLYSIKLEALFNGDYKYSLGNKDFSFIGGTDVVANGNGAFSSGKETFVTGASATGIGTINRVRSQTGTAIGYNNIVTGRHAVALNEGNKVLGYGAVGIGDHNGVYGSYDLCGGWGNKSFGNANFILGSANRLNGEYLVGFGTHNNAIGIYDIIQGTKNEVNGNYNSTNGSSNHILGNNNNINGTLNSVESSYNTVSGSENLIVATSYSNIINGYKNRIIAPDSIRNIISGVNNVIESGAGYDIIIGRDNIVKSILGNAFGQGLIVDGGYGNQLCAGRYNVVDRYARLIIGNGTSDTDRSNAFVVKNDGRAVLGADPKEKMDAVTKRYLDSITGDIESALDAIIQIQNGIIGGETA